MPALKKQGVISFPRNALAVLLTNEYKLLLIAKPAPCCTYRFASRNIFVPYSKKPVPAPAMIDIQIFYHTQAKPACIITHFRNTFTPSHVLDARRPGFEHLNLSSTCNGNPRWTCSRHGRSRYSTYSTLHTGNYT